MGVTHELRAEVEVARAHALEWDRPPVGLQASQLLCSLSGFRVLGLRPALASIPKPEVGPWQTSMGFLPAILGVGSLLDVRGRVSTRGVNGIYSTCYNESWWRRLRDK